MTCEEIGRLIGLSRERVRQIEQVALGKLRRSLEAKGVSSVDVAELLSNLGERV